MRPHPALHRCLRGLFAVCISLAAGCSAVELSKIDNPQDIQVKLDANCRAYVSGRTIKFYVDVLNGSSRTVDVRQIRIELRVIDQTRPDTISLRQSWTYNWPKGDPRRQAPSLKPGKKLTLPIVPEKGSEFPLELLAPGDYQVVAAVNERHTSDAYPLRVVRPELNVLPPRRVNNDSGVDSTIPVEHRKFESQSSGNFVPLAQPRKR